MSDESGGRNSPTAKRLRALMRAEGFEKHNLFAKFIGVEVPRWSNAVRGYPLSLDMAQKLRAKTGVTLDWLYHGTEAGLTVDMRDKLRNQLAAEDKNGTTTSSHPKTSGP